MSRPYQTQLRAFWLVTTIASGAVFPLAPASGKADEASRSLARDRLEREHPTANFYGLGDRVARIYGGPFGFGSSPEDTAERFLQEHAAVFGVAMDELDPRSTFPDQRHTQPMMFDKKTGEHKFTLVLYTQHIEDIPVYASGIRLLVRNEPGYPLVLVSNALRNLEGFARDPAALRAVRERSARGETAHPTLVEFTAPQLVIWAGFGESVTAPVLAYEFVGAWRADTGGDDRLFITGAVTGDVLYEASTIEHLRRDRKRQREGHTR